MATNRLIGAIERIENGQDTTLESGAGETLAGGTPEGAKAGISEGGSGQDEGFSLAGETDQEILAKEAQQKAEEEKRKVADQRAKDNSIQFIKQSDIPTADKVRDSRQGSPSRRSAQGRSDGGGCEDDCRRGGKRWTKCRQGIA